MTESYCESYICTFSPSADGTWHGKQSLHNLSGLCGHDIKTFGFDLRPGVKNSDGHESQVHNINE